MTAAPAPRPAAPGAAVPGPATARGLVPKVLFRGAGPRFSHETSAVAGVARALAHEIAPAAVMVWAVLAGHVSGSGPMLGATLALALISFAYAPLARTRHWAREHLADLWAMLLLMVALALAPVSGAESTFPHPGNVDSAPLTSGLAHGMGMGGDGMGMGGAFSADAPAAVVWGMAALVVIVGWVLARVLLARRAWGIHSLVSAAACGAGLAWMLLT